MKRYLRRSFAAVVVDALRVKLGKAEVQIRGGIEDNTKIILFLNENVCCDPSLEPSQ